jgi:hypothetical protein
LDRQKDWCVPELVAKSSGRLLLALSNPAPIDHRIVLVSSSVKCGSSQTKTLGSAGSPLPLSPVLRRYIGGKGSRMERI